MQKPTLIGYFHKRACGSIHNRRFTPCVARQILFYLFARETYRRFGGLDLYASKYSLFFISFVWETFFCRFSNGSIVSNNKAVYAKKDESFNSSSKLLFWQPYKDSIRTFE